MKRLTGFAAGLTALAIVTAGCATAPGAHARWHTGWEKPGMTGEQFVVDVRACDREGNRIAAGEPGHRAVAAPGPRTAGLGPMAPLRQAEHEKAYAECMMTKGYTAAKAN